MDLLSRFQQEPLPFARLLGIELRRVGPEKVVAEMTVREDLCTRSAALHGGAIMAFADTLGALGTIANLTAAAAGTASVGGATPGTVTIESKTNFVGPAPLGARITGEATPVHIGRRTMVWQTRVTTQDGKLVALTTQTQLVLPPAH
jgi:uncharacterized protein (TIGR00369 family)